MTHGTRQAYKAGCRCMPCRAAEASYRAHLRARHAAGKPILGARVSAAETWKRIRQLRPELGSNDAIAAALGLRKPSLSLHTGPDAMTTVRTLLRIKRLHRLVFTGGCE